VTAMLPLLIRKYFMSCSQKGLLATVANVASISKTKHQKLSLSSVIMSYSDLKIGFHETITGLVGIRTNQLTLTWLQNVSDSTPRDTAIKDQ
jgi:hypothetical protein